MYASEIQDANYCTRKFPMQHWLISPQCTCICQASPPRQLTDRHFISLILPVNPAWLSTHPPFPLPSHGPDEIQTLCGSILKWPNRASRRAKWKVVKSFEPLLHYNSPKHIQLGLKFREDIKAPLHVTLEDDNNWAPLKLLRRSTIKEPKSSQRKDSLHFLLAANGLYVSDTACLTLVISPITHTEDIVKTKRLFLC